MTTPEVLVFDLFGTLVRFDETRVPWREVAGRRVAHTIVDLDERLARILPGVASVDFLHALKRAGQELVEEKLRHGFEVPSPVRFQRALVKLGAEPASARCWGEELAERHMDTLARAVVCPPGRAQLLARLATSYRLALLSNFDHGATARRVLAEAGLLPFFETVVISEEEGIRKPAPAIFARCCERLGADPSSCLYIGDTFVEDVEGATAAGMAAIWVRPGADAEQARPACGAIGDVDELPGWLNAWPVSARDGASR